MEIQNVILKEVLPPGGSFYTTKRNLMDRDIIILKVTEPQLRGFQFVEALLTLCQNSGVKTIISLGSMYDNVIHTDTIVSALASNEQLLTSLKKKRCALH